MTSRKLVGLIYLGLSVFIFFAVSVTTTSVMDIIPALLFLWLSYFIYYLGGNGKRKAIRRMLPKYEETKISSWNIFIQNFVLKHKILLVLISFACSFIAANFYTGQTPLSVISGLKDSETLYFSYQAYFKANNLDVFSVRKLPYIFMNAVVNLLFVYSVITIVANKEKINGFDYVYLICQSLAFLYFGLARGTNFEIFEICCAFIFACVKRIRLFNIQIKFKHYAFVLLGALIAIGFFFTFIELRGYTGEYITVEIQYSENKFLPRLMPNFSHFISTLTAYFGFGFFYVSAMFQRYLFQDLGRFFASLFPGGLNIFGVNNFVATINKVIDGGTNWRPDTVWAVGVFGFFGLFIIFYLIGYASVGLESKKKDSIIDQVVEYYLFLQMFSFPIGNFIRISSANQIVCFGTLIILIIQNKIKISKKV